MYRLITANRNYSSWSLRPWVLMKTLGIPFEEEFVTFAGLDNHEEFRRFSPAGTVPALIDGERTVWDSLAITLYLADRHDGVWPTDEEAKAWAQCVVCEMHSGFSALRTDCTMNVGVRVRRNPDSPALKRDIARIREIFEEGLERFADHSWRESDSPRPTHSSRRWLTGSGRMRWRSSHSDWIGSSACSPCRPCASGKKRR